MKAVTQRSSVPFGPSIRTKSILGFSDIQRGIALRVEKRAAAAGLFCAYG
jgi:hypothetical protein